MKQIYRRGDIYYADLGDGMGSEQRGHRPVVIVSNDMGNKHSPTVIAVPLTSHFRRHSMLPTHYPLSTECGLERPSVILTEQVDTMDKQRLGRFIGKVDPCQMWGVNRALAVSVGLIEPRPDAMTVCLCNACANNFYGTGAYYLKRVRSHREKGLCTYCNHRPGFNYQVISR